MAALGIRRRGVHHEARSVDLHFHVGKHELRVLEIGNSAAELLTLFHVLHSLIKRPLRDTESLRTNRRARVIQGFQGCLETGPFVANDAVSGNAAILEVQLGRRRPLDP